MVLIVCLEGCHGCGKTSLIQQFSDHGFKVVDEHFLNMESYSLHPQTLTMEHMWVAHWMQRLLQMHHDQQRSGASKHSVFIADRSPYSAVFYSKRGGHFLEPLIQEMLRELAAIDIHVITVYVRVNPETLWSRISSRLLVEPQRVNYSEDKIEWMNKTIAFYEDPLRHWDFVVDNSFDSLFEVAREVCDQLGSQLPVWKQCDLPEGSDDESSILFSSSPPRIRSSSPAH